MDDPSRPHVSEDKKADDNPEGHYGRGEAPRPFLYQEGLDEFPHFSPPLSRWLLAKPLPLFSIPVEDLCPL